MTKINISGLSKEKVILALFKNVYGKSKEAIQAQSTIMRIIPEPRRRIIPEPRIRPTPDVIRLAFNDRNSEPGMYRQPYDFEISEILRRSKHIDYLGCVKFSMDFSNDIIDTDIYDKLHKTGTNGVELATDVIDKLRPKKEFKDELKSLDNITKSSFSHSRYSFTDSIKKQSMEKSGNKVVAEEKLTALLGKPVRLMHVYLDNYCFQFSPEQSYETLQKYAALLASKGITVIAKPPSSLFDNLVKISAKLEFEGSLSDIIAKLGSVVSSVTASSKILSPV